MASRLSLALALALALFPCILARAHGGASEGGTVIVEVSGPEDGLRIYVNGVWTGATTPARIAVERGDVVVSDWLHNGCWLISGDERFVRFKREAFVDGYRLYADVG
ncbi:MAG TPA: hypothetical protein ENF73_00385, partial [Proteobacteria bacterium]|nr:hypothetical protein [Pseudomonadota bacterium]